MTRTPIATDVVRHANLDVVDGASRFSGHAQDRARPHEGDVFSHEQAERLANALATYYAELRDDLVTKEYLDARLGQFEAKIEAKFDTRLGQLESKFDTRPGQLEASSNTQLGHLEAKLETQLARVQNRILASQVALFVLLGVAILLKP